MVANGRFRVIRLLGEGGFGEVYLAEQVSVEREVALKILHPALCRDAKVLARFEVEARNTCKLKHPNTVIFFDFGRDKNLDVLWLSMEYLEGEELKERLKREGPFSPERTLHLLEQVANSLAEAHERDMIHRDLKPANVMLVERGQDPDFVKVIDFGIAKIVGGDGDQEAELTKTGMLLGTPYYMAPEQVRGRDMDGRVDLYAMAVMAYEMLSGQRPFDGYSSLEIITQHMAEAAPSVLEFNSDLPPAMADVLLRALSKDPDDRPPNIQAFIEELRRSIVSDSEQTLNGVSGASLPSARIGGASLSSHIKPTVKDQPVYNPSSGGFDVTPAPSEKGQRPSWLPLAIGGAVLALVAVLVVVLSGGDEGSAEASSEAPSAQEETVNAEPEAPDVAAAKVEAEPEAPVEVDTTGLEQAAIAGASMALASVGGDDEEDEEDEDEKPKEKKSTSSSKTEEKAEKVKCKFVLRPWGELEADGKKFPGTGAELKRRRGEDIELKAYQNGQLVKKHTYTVPDSGGCKFTLKI